MTSTKLPRQIINKSRVGWIQGRDIDAKFIHIGPFGLKYSIFSRFLIIHPGTTLIKEDGILKDIVEIGKEVFDIEAAELSNVSKNLNSDFQGAVEAIFGCRGRLIVSGMGKSGLVGKKIAATLASTGTPSFFLHPGEAYHGDLGMIAKEDALLLISKSGETEEILKIIPFLKSQGNQLIAITSNPSSTLAKNAHFCLNIRIEKEACPLALAPTSSTTATLVMGDALAVALMKLRDFKVSDFAQFHPGGNLGRRLLTRVSDVMNTSSKPICSVNEDVKDVVYTISKGKCGIAIVLENERIVGVITDGDIRRAMNAKGDQFFKLQAKDLMTVEPKTIEPSTKLVKAQDLMNSYKVNSLVVAESGRFLGIVQIYDLQL